MYALKRRGDPFKLLFVLFHCITAQIFCWHSFYWAKIIVCKKQLECALIRSSREEVFKLSQMNFKGRVRFYHSILGQYVPSVPYVVVHLFSQHKPSGECRCSPGTHALPSEQVYHYIRVAKNIHCPNTFTVDSTVLKLKPIGVLVASKVIVSERSAF